jgi:D-amino peptidase
MNALVAGEFDVPVVFVSGCNLLKEEAVSHLPAILVGEVKRTVNQDASESLHPKRAREIIRESVKQALLTYGPTPAYRLSSKEYRFELEFSHTIYADIADTLPIVQKKNPVTVEFVADNILDGYYIVRSLIMMADSHESSI